MPRRKNGAESSAPGRDGRLTRLTHLLFRHPRGLCARELAEVCEVSPRQIQYDLKTLQRVGTPVYDVARAFLRPPLEAFPLLALPGGVVLVEAPRGVVLLL